MGTAVRSLSEDSHNLLCVQVALRGRHAEASPPRSSDRPGRPGSGLLRLGYGIGYGVAHMPVAIVYSYMPYSYGLYSPYMYGHGMYGRFGYYWADGLADSIRP